MEIIVNIVLCCSCNFFVQENDAVFIDTHSINCYSNIDDVDKTMDEINEQTENMKQIQEALSAPIGSAADFDEDELEAELEELEGAELEAQLLTPATTAPAAPVHSVPSGKQPLRPAAHKNTAEEDELAALQAEMAL
ncbi:Vacuolar protein sorting-associated protein 32 like 2 [Dendrobium catenatum]|uniref:Vacuolar protein sorting-associated protein 32 like 2 n=1 Tax=Dendrobium catenatum TaxID=906689 RepID=A0A2I0VZM3_9ASPA|nr:Vacuolar protein sorting-associated protein 32 like 2 [Dendrobium catenatum]